ncbi:MAG: hypothetical protein RL577_1655 [Bacteroidota bacterium]
MSAMNKLRAGALLAFLCPIALGANLDIWSSPDWGFPMHRLINRKACESLPEPLRSFYMVHQSYLEMHATDADSRRYAAADEACRHFIDADQYDQALPLDTLPLFLDSAVKWFGDSFVFAHGIVPYQCVTHTRKLQWAFEQQNLDAILRYSADLGHYAADANVPLHTHSNYNGQFTQQWGIHALWETELPYYYQDSLESMKNQALIVYDIPTFMHQQIETAHGLVRQTLEAEHQARKIVPLQAQYAFVWQGRLRKKMASWTLAQAYGQWVLVSIMQQYSSSIQTVASLWFTAWVMAGEPLLPTDKLGQQWPIPIQEENWDHE